MDNFSYKNLNRVIFKSKKLSQYKVNEKILFDGENIIINDEKGNIIIYSVEKQEVVYKYNFYKKRYKKLKKNLNIIIEDGVIYGHLLELSDGKLVLDSSSKPLSESHKLINLTNKKFTKHPPKNKKPYRNFKKRNHN